MRAATTANPIARTAVRAASAEVIRVRNSGVVQINSGGQMTSSPRAAARYHCCTAGRNSAPSDHHRMAAPGCAWYRCGEADEDEPGEAANAGQNGAAAAQPVSQGDHQEDFRCVRKSEQRCGARAGERNRRCVDQVNQHQKDRPVAALELQHPGDRAGIGKPDRRIGAESVHRDRRGQEVDDREAAAGDCETGPRR